MAKFAFFMSLDQFFMNTYSSFTGILKNLWDAEIIIIQLYKIIVQILKYGATYIITSCNSGMMYIFGEQV